MEPNRAKATGFRGATRSTFRYSTSALSYWPDWKSPLARARYRFFRISFVQPVQRKAKSRKQRAEIRRAAVEKPRNTRNDTKGAVGGGDTGTRGFSSALSSPPKEERECWKGNSDRKSTRLNSS